MYDFCDFPYSATVNLDEVLESKIELNNKPIIQSTFAKHFLFLAGWLSVYVSVHTHEN